jgi:hypothetical protein
MSKRVLVWALIAFLLFFVAYRPDSASEVFDSIGGGILDLATGIGDFFSGLVA